MSLAGTSLVAAIPGGLLAYLMLMSVLNSLQPMPTILKVAAILMLVTAAAVALFPAYVLIWYKDPRAVKKGTQPAAATAESDSVSEAVAPAESDVEEFGDAEESEDLESEEFVTGDDLDDVEATAAYDSAEFEAEEFGDVGGEEFEDEFEFEEFEEFEDEEK